MRGGFPPPPPNTHFHCPLQPLPGLCSCSTSGLQTSPIAGLLLFHPATITCHDNCPPRIHQLPNPIPPATAAAASRPAYTPRVGRSVGSRHVQHSAGWPPVQQRHLGTGVFFVGVRVGRGEGVGVGGEICESQVGA
jgi:hypothetical protein